MNICPSRPHCRKPEPYGWSGSLAGGPGETVVDIGCGWGERLLRVLAASPELHGVGVDTNARVIERARHVARERGLSARSSLIVGDAKSVSPPSAGSAICIGASQAWATDSTARGSPLDYGRALRSLRGLVAGQGRVVYGEAIWSTPPTAKAIAPLGGRVDEFVSLDELVEIAVSCDFMPVAFHEASLDEWDSFESGFSAPFANWLALHPKDHPHRR